MITINIPEHMLPQIREIISSEFRLHELVHITTQHEEPDIIVTGEVIHVTPDWKNMQPPVLFSSSRFTAQNLLGLIYVKLNNYEKAYPLLQAEPVLLNQADMMNRLQNGLDILFRDNDKAYIPLHNKAVIHHYTLFEIPKHIEELKAEYIAAIQKARTPELAAFTTKHYALLLTDAGQLEEAEELLEKQLRKTLPLCAAIEVKHTLCVIWLKQLAVPYNETKLEKHKQYLWECLEYYESRNRDAEAAMVLSDAAYIANISNSFSEALGYINRAIAYFEKEAITELLGDAFMKKGNILRRWAQQNNSQFFQQAAKTYQQALKIFTRETAPWLFADIHHQLGIIYSEIPDEVKKKSVWASVSVSSFKEALDFYNKVDFPYEFAVICNSQANAFTKYPGGLHSDNFEKALNWYLEALDVQTADKYPLERALTLLNYLEASWYAGNTSSFDEERFTDMYAKANEALALGCNEFIIQSAKEHLEKLKDIQQQKAATLQN
ncbi:MAG: hypothetical protein KF862_19135 [Chitinophagaceae bacterium]|nr:hypothetical protein [Chitinophagaceae bacterium]